MKTATTPDYSKCDEKFAGQFSKADAKGAGQCPSSATQTDIQTYITQCTDDVAVGLGGGPLPDCPVSLATCNTSLTTCTADLTTVNAGTAAPGDVLSGQTFSSGAGNGLAGTMPNNGAQLITPSTANQSIAAGYHNGSGYCAGDPHLVAGNIRKSVTLFGVAGTVQRPPVQTATLSPDPTTQTYADTRGATQTFTDNGDGTITDNTTALMWEKKSKDGGIHDWSAGYSIGGGGTAQSTFLATLNASPGFAGHQDWRIPTLNELETIRNLSYSQPMVHPAFNTGCVSGCTVTQCSCDGSWLYWSNSYGTVFGLSDYYWMYMDTNSGTVGSYNITTYPQLNTGYVRAVRGPVF